MDCSLGVMCKERELAKAFTDNGEARRLAWEDMERKNKLHSIIKPFNLLSPLSQILSSLVGWNLGPAS